MKLDFKRLPSAERAKIWDTCPLGICYKNIITCGVKVTARDGMNWLCHHCGSNVVKLACTGSVVVLALAATFAMPC